MSPSYAPASANGSASSAAAPAAGSARVTQLDAKHAYWTTNHDTWDILDLLYRGGAELQKQAARVFRKKPKELPEVYNCRLQAFIDSYILSTGLGWYQSALFRKDPTIE